MLKSHEDSKCHKEALANQLTVQKCGNTAESINKEFLKQRCNERQCLKVVMESLQFLVRQSIAFYENEVI